MVTQEKKWARRWALFYAILCLPHATLCRPPAFLRKKRNGEGGIRTRGTGLYPYDGLANRCTENTNAEKTKTCKTTETQLTPQLTPNSQKQGKIDTSELPSDLAEIVTIWPELPEHIKAAIKALIQTHKAEKE